MTRESTAGLLARMTTAGFRVRRHRLAPGTSETHEDGRWRDAMVVVERGCLVLECRRGRRYTYPAGSVLWLTGLPIRSLHNDGEAPVVLIAISREGPADRPDAR